MSAADIEGADVVCAVVDGRFFGPYDIKPISVVPAYNEYTVMGAQDRRFEHTALDAWEALADEAESILSGSPYSGWGDADTRATIVAAVTTAIQASKSLSEMRSALRDYGLSIFPDDRAAILGANRLQRTRAAAMAPVVPTSVSDNLSMYNATLSEVVDPPVLTGIARRSAPRVVPATEKRTLRDTGYTIPDAWNAPGDYRDRHIVCGFRALGSGLVAIQPPPDETSAALRHRQVELEIVTVGVRQAAWAISAERWRLQHNSAMATATWPDGLIDLAPNRLMFGVSRRDTDLWAGDQCYPQGRGRPLHHQGRVCSLPGGRMTTQSQRNDRWDLVARRIYGRLDDDTLGTLARANRDLPFAFDEGLTLRTPPVEQIRAGSMFQPTDLSEFPWAKRWTATPPPIRRMPP